MTAAVVTRAPAATGSPTAPGHHRVVVVGGGQAGLSVSWYLAREGIDHVVLERESVAHEWSDSRWDSFCLVTPNWQCRLPGFPYAGTDPDGFMVRSEIVAYLRAFRESFDPPVREGVAVTSLDRRADGLFALTTTDGEVTADEVVVATGGYHLPIVPRWAERLPEDVVQVHSSRYRRPDQLPAGAVLVVGSGQSGAQIAEDLHLAGRQVHLCVGSAPRVARTYRGRDVVAWVSDMGRYDTAVADLPDGGRRRYKTNEYVTGRDGGRDIDLRAFARDGMALYGHLLGLRAGILQTADDLESALDGADRYREGILDSIDGWIAERGIEAPTEARYTPVWRPDPQRPLDIDLAAAGITGVVWAIGYRPDYSWVRLPAFDGRGHPQHDRGVTSVDGLYVLGLPWLHTWGSGRFAGIARDAEHLACVLAARAGVARAGAGAARAGAARAGAGAGGVPAPAAGT